MTIREWLTSMIQRWYTRTPIEDRRLEGRRDNALGIFSGREGQRRGAYFEFLKIGAVQVGPEEAYVFAAKMMFHYDVMVNESDLRTIEAENVVDDYFKSSLPNLPNKAS